MAAKDVYKASTVPRLVPTPVDEPKRSQAQAQLRTKEEERSSETKQERNSGYGRSSTEGNEVGSFNPFEPVPIISVETRLRRKPLIYVIMNEISILEQK